MALPGCHTALLGSGVEDANPPGMLSIILPFPHGVVNSPEESFEVDVWPNHPRFVSLTAPATPEHRCSLPQQTRLIAGLQANVYLNLLLAPFLSHGRSESQRVLTPVGTSSLTAARKRIHITGNNLHFEGG